MSELKRALDASVTASSDHEWRSEAKDNEIAGQFLGRPTILGFRQIALRLSGGKHFAPDAFSGID
jgi:hypothetical protein